MGGLFAHVLYCNSVRPDCCQKPFLSSHEQTYRYTHTYHTMLNILHIKYPGLPSLCQSSFLCSSLAFFGESNISALVLVTVLAPIEKPVDLLASR